MKRLLPRLLGLSVVLALGVIAIAQALRGSQTPKTPSEEPSAMVSTEKKPQTLEPVPVEPHQQTKSQSLSDPFTSSQFVSSVASAPASSSRFSRSSSAPSANLVSQSLPGESSPSTRINVGGGSSATAQSASTPPPPLPSASRFSVTVPASVVDQPSPVATDQAKLPADPLALSSDRVGSDVPSSNENIRAHDLPLPRMTISVVDHSSDPSPVITPGPASSPGQGENVADPPSAGPLPTHSPFATSQIGNTSGAPLPAGHAIDATPGGSVEQHPLDARQSVTRKYENLIRQREPVTDPPNVPKVGFRSTVESGPEAGNGSRPEYGLPAATTAQDLPTAIPVQGDRDTETMETSVSGQPGPAQLEGVQAPMVTIEKLAPSEIQIGKPAEFQTNVRNTGTVTATQVVIRDQIPTGTRLISTTPPTTNQAGGNVVWQLGSLEPGEEKTVSMQLMPVTEGEVGSVATATFQMPASVRTLATRPLLNLEHTAPSKVNIGGTVTLNIVLSNPGTGATSNVVLEEDVPDGLSHPAGKALEFEVGTLKPGETRELDLTLTAEKAGFIENRIVAHSDANLVAEHRLQLEVIAPQLRVSITGPTKRYLERKAIYTINVANPGTASARDIELVTYLPKGLKYIDANNAGQYDSGTHAVYWSLEELPPKQMGSVKLTIVPIKTGDQKLRVDGRGATGLQDTLEKSVFVDGLASLFFEVVDMAEPIEVGEQTTYEIQLANKGSKSSTNIRVQAIFPPGLKPIAGNGPTRGEVDRDRIQFQPLTRLAPGADAFYKVDAQGVAVGDQRIRVQVFSDEMQSPVIEEESTLVYSDQ